MYYKLKKPLKCLYVHISCYVMPIRTTYNEAIGKFWNTYTISYIFSIFYRYLFI